MLLLPLESWGYIKYQTNLKGSCTCNVEGWLVNKLNKHDVSVLCHIFPFFCNTKIALAIKKYKKV